MRRARKRRGCCRARALALVAALAAAGTAGCSLRGGIEPSTSIPVAAVERGNLGLEVDATGALRATRIANLIAPPIGGGTLEIIRLLPSGAAVKAGDVVAAFDPSGQEYNLEQSRADLEQAQEEIVEAKDNAAVQAAEDQTAVLKAQFAVRQAQLKVKMNEMVSAIEGKENLLALDAANRALAETEQDIKSHAASSGAAVVGAQQKLAKARLGITQAEQNLGKMELKSPIAGLVVLDQNYEASGPIMFVGMSPPDFHVGDQVNAGNGVARVIDLGKLEVAAEIPQEERANIAGGDPVEIHVEAIPGVTFRGKVAPGSGIATGFTGAGLNAEVQLTIEFDKADRRLRPGFAVRAEIFGLRLQNALTVPREAVFDLTGTPAVYVKKGSGFERRNVKIRYLTDATVVIAGLAAGTEVALVNPEQQGPRPATPPAMQPPAGGAPGVRVVSVP